MSKIIRIKMKQAKPERDAATLTLLPEMSNKMKQAKPEGEEAGYAITLLPEPLIHLIQSFLTIEEAAQTTLLSKSWYDAWLTRPTISFDEQNFQNKGGFGAFEKISTETMKRYRDMNLRIESFSLRKNSFTNEIVSLAQKLTADAIEIGATDLNIEASPYPSEFVLPPEVLGSETLTRLRLRQGTIADGNVIRCSRLKSLILYRVHLGSDDDILRDIISRCTSIEEFSLFCVHRKRLNLSEFNLFQLHKLRRLNLQDANIGESFFSDLASGFRCLKDLSIRYCTGYTRIQIASTSLEHISLFGQRGALMEAEFDVPNIRRFVYSDTGSSPSVRFKACSSEWKSDISVRWSRNHKPSELLSLKKMLEMLRGSRISLSITLYPNSTEMMDSERISREIKDVVVVERLRINALPYSSCFSWPCS